MVDESLSRLALPGPGNPGRLHPFTLLLGPVKELRGWLIPVALALGLGTTNEGFGPGVGFLLVAVGLGLAGQLAKVIRLRWWVAEGSFQLQTGVLQIERRTLPLDRVQNVDIIEPLLPRLLGLAEVRIESAGATGVDVELRYVALAQARLIRDRLGERTAAEESEPSTPPTEMPIVATPTGELLVAGATANRIGALAAGAAIVVSTLSEGGVDPLDLIRDAGDAVDVQGSAPVLVTLTALAAVLVGWVVSIAETVLRYHGFTLTLRGEDEAVRRHGLLTRASGVIPLHRVQAVRADRPLLRRLLRYATVLADTAGSVAAGAESGTGVVAPIVAEARLPGLVSIILRRPGTEEGALTPVSRLAIRRGLVRAVVPVLVVSAGGAVATPSAGLLAIPGLALAWWWARRRFAAIGYRLEPDLLVARAGLLNRRTWWVPTAKVQSALVRRTIFQRRLGLASLSVDTAGPGTRRVVVIDLELAEARRLAEALSEVSARTAFSPDGV
jgi:putative membrane protein